MRGLPAEKGLAYPTGEWRPQLSSQRMSVGLDVHARSVVSAAIDERTGEVVRRRFGYDPAVVVEWVRSLPQPAAVTYEAGPTGFALARSFASAGIECQVAAPSKLQRPTGDRVKTDARDALHLARLLRLGEIVAVRIPSLGLIGSMGRVGAAGDNAAMESFFSLLQKNVLNSRPWPTRIELRLAIVTWIEATYHRRRRQRALGRLTPVEFEAIMTTPAASAA